MPGQYQRPVSVETPNKLMERLRTADALMAKPEWHVGMFDKHSPEWNACARRYWYEKARELPVHFNARAHYINLLQQQVEFYEFKHAEASLVTAAKAEVEKKAAAAAAAAAAATAAKAAVAEAAAKALAVKKRKREEEKAYFRSWLAPRSASAGVKIYSIFDDNCICEPVRGLSL